jgi:hypothetical protein
MDDEEDRTPTCALCDAELSDEYLVADMVVCGACWRAWDSPVPADGDRP